MIPSDLKSRVANRWLEFEGFVGHLYQDTEGYVTIGAGHLVPSPEAAARLPFFARDSRLPATGNQIFDEYQRVKSAPRGFGAPYYLRLTNFEISLRCGADLMSSDISGAYESLCRVFPKFESLPPSAREALLDMACNMGVGGLLSYKKLLGAVSSGDWQSASDESGRRQVSASRNRAIRNLFLACCDPQLT